MEGSILKKKLKNWNFDVKVLGEEEMFKASVLVPLIILNKKMHILFQVRAKNIRQGGEISFPGGRFDNGDSSFEYTALRETHEELGIGFEKIEIIGELDTLVSPFNSIIRAYLGVLDIDSLEELNPNKDEVDSLLAVPLKWLQDTKADEYHIHSESHPHIEDEHGQKLLTFPAKELGLPKVYHSSWKGKTRKVYLYKYQDEKIWGFTALILRDALAKLKKLGI